MNEILNTVVPVSESLPASPYPGIEPYSYAHRKVFFAREAETRALIRLIVMYRGVLLFSDSGTGKSSLINAGLIPRAIQEGYRPERIRVQPRRGQEIVIERISENNNGQPHFLPSIFAPHKKDARIVLSIRKFLEILQRKASDAHPLLIFDQFEEWVTLFEGGTPDQTQEGVQICQQRILDTLVGLINTHELPVKVLIALREDYLAKLTPLFERCTNLPDQYLRLTPLSGEQVYRAIRGPFDEYPEVYPTQFSSNLAQEIQTQLEARVQGGDIRLTEVQIVCAQLWDRYAPEKPVVMPEDFIEEMGGVQGILEGYLESELGKFESPELRSLAVEVLASLTTAADTRDIVSAPALNKLLDGKDLSLVLPILEGRRLIYRTIRRGTDYYELANEYLIPPIQRERHTLEIKHQRAQAERQAREAAEDRANKIYRLLAVTLAAALLAALVLAFNAIQQRREAETSQATLEIEVSTRQAAEKNLMDEINLRTKDQAAVEISMTIATSRQLALQALGALGDDPQLGLLLAIEALKYSQTPDAERSMYAALQAPPVRSVLGGHKGSVRGLDFTPNGYLLASIGDDMTARLWDINLGNERARFKGHDAPLVSLDISPDGQWLATLDSAGDAHLWNIKPFLQAPEYITETSIITASAILTGYQGSLNALVFSPVGLLLAGGDSDGHTHLWQIPTEPISRTLDHPPTHTLGCTTTSINTVAFSPDGSLLATGSDDGTVNLWDVASRAKLAYNNSSNSRITSLTFSPDGEWLAIGAASGDAFLWDLSIRDEEIAIKNTRITSNITFSPDGAFLATANKYGYVSLQDIKTGEYKELKSNSTNITTIQFSPDGRLLAGSSSYGQIQLWNTPSLELRSDLGQQLGGITSAAFSPGGTMLASAGENGDIWLWDIAGKELHSMLPNDGGEISDMAFDKSGLLATGGGSAKSPTATLSMWEIPTEAHWIDNARQIISVTLPHEQILDVAYSPNGHRVATGGITADKMGIVRAWDVSDVSTALEFGTTQEVFTTTLQDENVFHLSLNEDGNLLALLSVDDITSTLHLWDVSDALSTGESVQLISMTLSDRAISNLAFSPNGNWLAFGGSDSNSEHGVLHLFDLQTLRIPGRHPISITVPLAETFVTGVVFSPDSSLLAIAGDPTVNTEPAAAYLWEVAKLKDSAEPLITLRASSSSGGFLSVAFSPDNGRLLAAGGQDGRVRLWDIPAAKETGGEGAEAGELRGSDNPLLTLAFDPAGGMLTALDSLGTVHAWTFEEDSALIDLACERAIRPLTQAEWNIYRGPHSNPQSPCPDPGISLIKAETLLMEARETARSEYYKLAGAQFDEAQRFYPLLDIQPTLEIAQGLVDYGYRLADSEEYTQAQVAFLEAIKFDRKLASTLVPTATIEMLKGRVYARQGQMDQALDAYKLADELNPGLLPAPEQEVSWAAIQQGNIHAYQGEYDAALNDYQQAEKYVSTASTSQEVINQKATFKLAEYLIRLCEDWLCQGETEQASEALQEVLDSTPDLQPRAAQKFIGFGNSLAESGWPEQAMSLFQQTLDLEPGLQPDVVKVLIDSGVSLALIGRVEPAWAMFQKAIELQPESQTNIAEVLIERGFDLVYAKQVDPAMTMFQLAFEIEPGSLPYAGWMLIESGYNFLYSSEPEMARVLFQHAVEFDPSTRYEAAQGLMEVGYSLLRYEDKTELALAAYQQAMELEPELQPDVAQALVEVGHNFVREGKSEQALNVLRQALELNPVLQIVPELEVASAQANLFAEQSQFGKAIDTLQQFAAQNPEIVQNNASALAKAYNDICQLGDKQSGGGDQVVLACTRAAEQAANTDDPYLNLLICANQTIAGSTAVSPACDRAGDLSHPIHFGDIVSGTVEIGGRYAWAFDGQEGQIITIQMDQDQSELDAYLMLFGPDATRLIVNNNSGMGRNALIGDFKLPNTGQYIIIARGYLDMSEGAYKLTLSVEG